MFDAVDVDVRAALEVELVADVEALDVVLANEFVDVEPVDD